MIWKQATMALLAALLLAPAISAEVSVTPDENPVAMPPDATTTVGFTASLPCSDMVDAGVVTGGGSLTKTLMVAYPIGFTGPESVDVTFSGAQCVPPTGSATTVGTIDITALADAPGMAISDIVLDDAGTLSALPVKVGYRTGHTFVVDAEFPMEVGTEPVSWNATLTVTANADTMVMTNTNEKAQFGSVSGIFPFKNFRDIPAEGSSETITLTYTPAGGDWTEDHITFTLWSHFMDDGALKTVDEEITWTFVSSDTSEGTPEETQGSPGFGLVAALGLIGAAAVAIRRRS